MTAKRTIFMVAMLSLPVACNSTYPAVLADDDAHVAGHQQDLLRLIDSKAVLSIGFRNPMQMIKKSQEINDRANLTPALNIDTFVDTVCKAVGLERCVDKSKPIALSLSGPNIFSFKISVSVTDVNALASSLDVSAETLQKGEAYKLPKPIWTLLASLKFIRLKGNQLTMSPYEALLDDPRLEDSLGETLSAKEAETLANDDIVIVLGESAFKGQFRSFLEYYTNADQSLDSDQEDAVGKFLDDLKYVVSGIHLDNGIGTTTIASLKSSDSKSLLGEFFDNTRDATLARMPSGKILATHALQADSNNTGGLLGALLSKTRNAISNQIARISIDSESFQLDGLLSEALDRIKGGHLVLYESSNRNRYGDVNLLGVFTTDDPDAFLADLTGLAPFVNAAFMTEAEAAIAFPPAKIEGLVAELGESHYQRRELAKFRLKLLGARARPALEKATKARDLELRLAAKDLLKTFVLDATTGRADLIKGGLFKKLNPFFTYAAQQEKLADSNVGILTMKFESDAQQTQNKMKALFGPEDRKSTRLNSSHCPISYAVFCLKKKNMIPQSPIHTQDT